MNAASQLDNTIDVDFEEADQHIIKIIKRIEQSLCPSFQSTLQEQQSVNHALGVDWIERFITQPHAQLGRKGAVCPFVKPLHESASLYFGHLNAQDLPFATFVQVIMQIPVMYERVRQRLGIARERFATAIFIDGLTEDKYAKYIDMVHSLAKPVYMDSGLMLGEFHPHSAVAGVHSQDFRPMRCEVPAFAIRAISSHDHLFIDSDSLPPVDRLHELECYAKWIGGSLSKNELTSLNERIATFQAGMAANNTESSDGAAMSTDKKPAPAQAMMQMLQGYQMTQMLYVAAELKLSDILQDGPKSVEDLAHVAEADPGSLFRLLRTLAGNGIYAQRQDGRFELTALAATLCRDAEDSVRPFALSYGKPWWWNAYGQLLQSVRTGVSGFELAHGKDLFAFLSESPQAAATFNGNMGAMTHADAKDIVQAYDFSDAGTVVDIGGGVGVLVTAILQNPANAHVRGVVFDQAQVIAEARNSQALAGLAERCELQPGSFFDRIPRQGDIYILKDIVHDWSDALAQSLLEKCCVAMHGQARLLVIERNISPGNEFELGKQVDITMMALTGGRERTLAEYQNLFGLAGLRLRRSIALPNGSSILELMRQS